MSRIVILFIKFYQYCISPYLAPSCKFSPTCSQYACDALSKHGFFKGMTLATWRILRCNPWGRGGYEPVP